MVLLPKSAAASVMLVAFTAVWPIGLNACSRLIASSTSTSTCRIGVLAVWPPVIE
jgi:hypothetical protein